MNDELRSLKPQTFADAVRLRWLMLAAAVISIALTRPLFQQLDGMCARDAERMWGLSLCGPTLFVERTSRQYVAGDAGVISSGTLPPSIGIANTSVDWNGKRWTMIVWPLPSDPYARGVLLGHESFHRIQPRLGLASSSREGSNAHLDTVEGRYWLQLEWRALAAALRGQANAVDDALAFRARRRQLFPGAAEEERAMEMNEGLAEYTGTALAEPRLSRRIPHLLKALRDAESTPSFVRSFAYASGPAWGGLLEVRDRRWTRALRPNDDLAALIGSSSADADARAARYGGTELLARERARDEKRQAMLRAFQARFVDQPTLALPLHNMQFEMNPNDVQPFPQHGSVFPALTLRDDWGSIDVRRGGALITSDWLHLIVPRPPSDDYTLTLNTGWTMVPGPREHDLMLDKR